MPPADAAWVMQKAHAMPECGSQSPLQGSVPFLEECLMYNSVSCCRWRWRCLPMQQPAYCCKAVSKLPCSLFSFTHFSCTCPALASFVSCLCMGSLGLVLGCQDAIICCRTPWKHTPGTRMQQPTTCCRAVPACPHYLPCAAPPQTETRPIAPQPNQVSAH